MKFLDKTSYAIVLCFALLPVGCKRPSAQEVLDKMVDAYQKAESYSDRGEIRLVAEVEDQKIDDEPTPFSVTLVRPEKIAVRAYQVEVVLDDHQTLARLRDLGDQALVKDPPKKLTLDAVYCDPLLTDKLVGRFGVPPQLVLLLGNEPLKQILGDAETPELIGPGEIDGHKCHRVRAKWPGDAGAGTFWIDQETFLLRRLEYPVGGQEKEFFPGRKVKSLTVTADFKEARFDAKARGEAFQIAFPEGAEPRKFFLEPDPRQLLARTIDPFAFVDLDGNRIDRDGLAGKIAVLCFWDSQSPESQGALDQLEKLSQAHASENAAVQFLAVSVDPGDRENKTLIETTDKWGVRLLVVRDAEQHVFTVFRTKNVPTVFVLDARGRVQHCETGVNPNLAAELGPKLAQLAAGKSVYIEPLRRYRDEVARQERLLAVKAAEKSQPAKLKLARLWKSADVKEPGNILVVEGPKETARLVVLSGPRAVAEVGLDGKLLATHQLDIDAEQEAVALLRSAVAADGTRYFAAFAPEQQRVHLFDAKWKKLLSYPPDALEKDARHAGIADCTLADLDGDGTPEIYVGYLGVVGVQAVSLEGKRLFANRLANAYRLAVGDRDQQGRRPLLVGTAAESVGTIVLLDEKLERRGEVLIADCPLRWFAGADLSREGDGPVFAGAKTGTVPKLAWCGLAMPRMGDNIAVGLDLAGKETWRHALPEGFHQQAVEPIVGGRVTSAPPGQWLLPGCDGSIHILSADGTPLDKFNYGALLSGLATATIDGKPALIVATPGGIEALRAE